LKKELHCRFIVGELSTSYFITIWWRNSSVNEFRSSSGCLLKFVVINWLQFSSLMVESKNIFGRRN